MPVLLTEGELWVLPISARLVTGLSYVVFAHTWGLGSSVVYISRSYTNKVRGADPTILALNCLIFSRARRHRSQRLIHVALAREEVGRGRPLKVNELPRVSGRPRQVFLLGFESL